MSRKFKLRNLKTNMWENEGFFFSQNGMLYRVSDETLDDNVKEITAVDRGNYRVFDEVDLKANGGIKTLYEGDIIKIKHNDIDIPIVENLGLIENRDGTTYIHCKEFWDKELPLEGFKKLVADNEISVSWTGNILDSHDLVKEEWKELYQ